jgi:RNA polymerase-interacting CarD/CdnL/TRCF family regulator
VTDTIIRPSSRFVKKNLRKVVTGDEKKRVRDLIKEKKEKPQNVKLFDKVSTTAHIKLL